MVELKITSATTLMVVVMSLISSDIDAQELYRPDGSVLATEEGSAIFHDLGGQVLSPFEIRQLDDFRFRGERLPRTTAHVHVEETVDPLGKELKANGFDGLTIEFNTEWFEAHLYGDVLEEMCDALNSVSFGIVDTKRHTHFSIGRSPRDGFSPSCEVFDAPLEDAIADASETFSEKKLYRWRAGVSGYILFTNSLFPDRGGDYGIEIESDRLVNLLSMAITDDPGQHRYYEVDRVTVREEKTECVCVRGLTKELIRKKTAAPPEDACTSRDKNGIVCIGSERKWNAEIRNRWYFDPKNLNKPPRNFSSFRSSDLPLFRSDVNPEIYVHLWCQIDPYFPCSDIEIQVLGPPPPGGSRDSYQFSAFLAHALCDWDCNTRIDKRSIRPRRTNDFNIQHISMERARGWDDFIEQANQEISRFSVGDFGFLAIPATVAFEPGINLSGLLPVSTKDNNLTVSEEIRSGRYFLLHDFMITMTTFALEDEPIRGYLRYIYSRDTGPQYSCESSNFECLANMHREKPPRSLWFRPIH